MNRLCFVFWLLLLIGCGQSAPPTSIAASSTSTATTTAPISTVVVTVPPTPTRPIENTPTATRAEPTRIPTSTPVPNFTPCGVTLPAVLTSSPTPNYEWTMPYIDETLIPSDALPAAEQFFAHPEDVSLVVYKLDYEGVGFYHNADVPMPLASVSKLSQLVAYAEQVDAGVLDPSQPVAETDLTRFYLPSSDLNAHRRALAAFDENDLTLSHVVTMTIRYSANSAADYLHTLLEQETVEQTLVDLGVDNHSAPCTFLGKFLMMGDGGGADSNALIQQLATDSTRYGWEVARRREAYLSDAAYQTSAEQHWRQRRTPSIFTQASFVNELETRGTTTDYARLMAGVVRGEIGSATTNAQIRAALEWPYEAFEGNREQYLTIGYKNGTLPTVLTSVYYSWPIGSDRPVVLALFYRNLPLDVYQRWRRDLPHDAFAHWLMSDPNAIHAMHVWRNMAASAEP